MTSTNEQGFTASAQIDYQFSPVPDDLVFVYGKHVGGDGIALYTVLYADIRRKKYMQQHFNRQKIDYTVKEASIYEIGSTVGLSENTTIKYLRILEACGIIIREARYIDTPRRKQQQVGNHYTLTHPDTWHLPNTDPKSPPPQSDQDGPNNNPPQNSSHTGVQILHPQQDTRHSANNDLTPPQILIEEGVQNLHPSSQNLGGQYKTNRKLEKIDAAAIPQQIDPPQAVTPSTAISGGSSLTALDKYVQQLPPEEQTLIQAMTDLFTDVPGIDRSDICNLYRSHGREKYQQQGTDLLAASRDFIAAYGMDGSGMKKSGNPRNMLRGYWGNAKRISTENQQKATAKPYSPQKKTIHYTAVPAMKTA